jgi:hypothetical protein
MPRSQAERLWMIAGGLVAFLMVLVGYVFFISPQRDQTASVDSQVQSVQAANTALQNKLDLLAAQNKRLPYYQALAAQAQLALPGTSGLSAFLRTLQALGGSTHTDVTSLSASSPVDVTSAATAPVSAVAPGTTGAASGTGVNAAASNGGGNSTGNGNAAATTEGVAPSSGTAAAAAGNQARVYALPITMTVTGAVPALDQFLTQLQLVQPRAVLVTQVNEAVAGARGSGPVVGAASAGSTSLTMTLYAFVAPSTAVEASQLQNAAAGK